MPNNATCIYCGAERPIDEDLCPNCGRPWIDQWIDEAGVGSVAAGSGVGGPAVTAASPPPKRRWRSWVIAGIIALAVIGVYAVIFGVALSDAGNSPSTTGSTIGLSSTTAAPVTASATTSTAGTTTLTPLFPEIPAVGEPIAIEDLTLGAFSLGPLDFGDTDAQALGRLVASLGQPDEVGNIGEQEGLCPTNSGTQARWGWLTALFRTEDDTDVLVSYRVEPDLEQPDHSTSELATISGAAIGDTLGALRGIYDPLPVTTTDFEGEPGWILTRLSDERTLLWGIATGDTDDDLVTAIVAPRPCDGGPFASG